MFSINKLSCICLSWKRRKKKKKCSFRFVAFVLGVCLVRATERKNYWRDATNDFVSSLFSLFSALHSLFQYKMSTIPSMFAANEKLTHLFSAVVIHQRLSKRTKSLGEWECETHARTHSSDDDSRVKFGMKNSERREKIIEKKNAHIQNDEKRRDNWLSYLNNAFNESFCVVVHACNAMTLCENRIRFLHFVRFFFFF